MGSGSNGKIGNNNSNNNNNNITAAEQWHIFNILAYPLLIYVIQLRFASVGIRCGELRFPGYQPI